MLHRCNVKVSGSKIQYLLQFYFLEVFMNAQSELMF